jgi:hypothetical protein
MAKLKAKTRNALPSSEFGMPGERKYPMPDKSHAANAKARAAQQLAAGRLTKAQHDAIVAKANRMLGEKSQDDRLDAYMKKTYGEA